MSTKEQISRELNQLSFDELQLAALYAEFAEEDQQLAEEGMAEYAGTLTREDAVTRGEVWLADFKPMPK